MPSTLSIFFGAGAEVGYGMPSGGRFALDIFRRNLDGERAAFKVMRDGIDPMTPYATEWLPPHYQQKRISVFGRQDKAAIFESSLEYRRRGVREQIEGFDTLAGGALATAGIAEGDLGAVFQALTGYGFGTRTYAQVVELNPGLGAGDALFRSRHFSAMLDVLRRRPGPSRLRELVRAILQLYVGSIGQDLVSSLNDQLFQKAPDDIAVFDDLAGIFRLDYARAGLGAYEVVLEEEAGPLDLGTPVETVFGTLAFLVLEQVMSTCLDYQSLVDDNFRYLYAPQEWARFTKIATFLMSVRSYVAALETVAVGRIGTVSGYYDDLAAAIGDRRVGVLHAATANYTSLFDRAMAHAGHDVTATKLNGSLVDFYDPYRNEIAPAPTPDEPGGRFLVPFMFTQSGIKPLTSIQVSRRYVDFYDQMTASDAVAVVGFGFNADDGHINGMFRSIVDEGRVPFSICEYVRDAGSFEEERSRASYARRLRVDDPSGIRIVPVLADRTCPGGRGWIERVLAG